MLGEVIQFESREQAVAAGKLRLIELGFNDAVVSKINDKDFHPNLVLITVDLDEKNRIISFFPDKEKWHAVLDTRPTLRDLEEGKYPWLT